MKVRGTFTTPHVPFYSPPLCCRLFRIAQHKLTKSQIEGKPVNNFNSIYSTRLVSPVSRRKAQRGMALNSHSRTYRQSMFTKTHSLKQHLHASTRMKTNNKHKHSRSCTTYNNTRCHSKLPRAH